MAGTLNRACSVLYDLSALMAEAERAAKRPRYSQEPCTIRFANSRPEVTASVFWVDREGREDEREVKYAQLDNGCYFNQDTFEGHPWRLRDAASGSLLAEYVGPSATLTLLPGGGLRVQRGLHRPPPADVSDARWGAWRPRGLACGGLPVLAFDCVCQEAVEAAEQIVEHMLREADAGVVAAMAEAGAEIAIIGKDQVTTDLPMYRHLRGVECGNGSGDYDKATRGLGGNPGNPTTSCGEENLLMLPGDRYRFENILVHEFGHAVMDLGLHKHLLRDKIVAAYRAAREGGRYDPSCYMMANECEYWAEGTQAWFDGTAREDVTSGVNTRDKLKERDPQLAELLSAVYGDGAWRYPQSAPRAFPQEDSKHRSKRQRSQQQGQQQPEVAVLVEGLNPMTQPLLTGGGGISGVARRGGRRKGGGGAQHGGNDEDDTSKLTSVPRRITRAFARLVGGCFGAACLP